MMIVVRRLRARRSCTSIVSSSTTNNKRVLGIHAYQHQLHLRYSPSSSDSTTTMMMKRTFSTTSQLLNTKTVEQKYQKKTPIEHVLERPDTYVGSVERITKQMFILQHDKDDGSYKIVNKQVSYVPALYRIVDELLVNAVDNHHRSGTGTNEIKVNISENMKDFWIHIYNNGKSVPVTIHKEEKIYVPELVFGHLLTGSNFDDNEVKLTGGRNGYGAKLANIFSEKFIVEVADPLHQSLYKQEWSNNMGHCESPVITSIAKSRKSGDGHIKISLKPDLSKFANFESEEQHDDFLALLKRRVFDLAACNSQLKVYLNDSLVPVSSMY
jgi:DNA topoisomerase-2